MVRAGSNQGKFAASTASAARFHLSVAIVPHLWGARGSGQHVGWWRSEANAVCKDDGFREELNRPASLPLRPRKRDLAFGAEDIAVEARDPLASARGHVEIANFGLNMGRHAIEVELRVAIDDVGG